MSCFSAPCGYFTWTGVTSIVEPSGTLSPMLFAVSRMILTAPGLFDSIPTMPRVAPTAFMMSMRPSRIPSGRSSIRR